MAGSALRQLLLELGFEYDEKAEQGIHRAIAGVKKAAVALGAAFGVREIGRFFDEAIEKVTDVGDHTAKAAQQLGVSAQALQELEHSAKLSGGSAEFLRVSLSTLQRQAYQASIGGKEAAKSFAELGISVNDGNGKLKPAEVLLSEMADGLSKMKDESKRVAIAQRLMGEGGGRLIPMLNKGSAGLDAMREDARQLGVVMGEDLLKASEDYKDSLLRNEQATLGLKSAMVSEMLPTLIAFKDEATELVKELRPVAKMIGQTIVESVRFLGRILRGFGMAMQEIVGLIMRSLNPFSIALATLGLTFMMVRSAAVMAGVQSAAAWIAATLPLILTIALLAIIIGSILLVIEDLVAMGDGAESVAGTMVQGFNDLVDELGGIGPAIAEMLKVALEYWLNFFGLTKDEAKDFVDNLSETLGSFWTNTVDGWKQILSGFFSWLLEKFESIPGVKAAMKWFSGDGGQNIAGVNSSSGVAAPAPYGGVSVNAGRNNVTVNATVTGVSTPDQVGGAIAGHVSSSMDNEYMLAQQAFVNGVR